MHYNLQNLEEPTRNFASRFTLQLWQYVVPPRTPEDRPYIVDLDFAEDPLFSFVEQFAPQSGDVLEVFTLRRRVLVTGVSVEVAHPTAGLLLRPVTNSGMVFDEIDCSIRSKAMYAIDGGIVDRATNLVEHSVLIDDPDYFGFQIIGSGDLTALCLEVQLAVSDQYSYKARTNRRGS